MPTSSNRSPVLLRSRLTSTQSQKSLNTSQFKMLNTKVTTATVVKNKDGKNDSTNDTNAEINVPNPKKKQI